MVRIDFKTSLSPPALGTESSSENPWPRNQTQAWGWGRGDGQVGEGRGLTNIGQGETCIPRA